MRPPVASNKATTPNQLVQHRPLQSQANESRIYSRTPQSEGQQMIQVPSDEEVGRQILGVFLRNKVCVGGTIRHNKFVEVRDGDFQRGLNNAIENGWVKLKMRDRYTYVLTHAGFATF
jgi:hypothetical protein